MSAPRHVLMSADTVGGIWSYAMELARALSRHEVRVSLATMGVPLSSSQRAEASLVPGLDLYESCHRLEWMEHAWDDVDKAGEWLLSLERALKPDIVHLNGFAHGNLAWQAPTVIVGHSCVLSWWNAVKRFPAPAQWDEYRARVTKGLHGAGALAAVSGFMATELDRHYGPLPPVNVIYNSRNSLDFAPVAKDDIILSCGRVWDEAKNMQALDKAAGFLRWPVYVAGEHRHPEGGLASLQYAHPIGSISPSELRSWYARAAIYALPARYEPFGLSVLEAALSGCALVLGDIPSLREIWKEAAVFVPSDDCQALASAIGALSADKGLSHELGRLARARALSFTPERMAGAYLELYSRMQPRHQEVPEGLSCAS
jgi:glycogen synthase